MALPVAETADDVRRRALYPLPDHISLSRVQDSGDKSQGVVRYHITFSVSIELKLPETMELDEAALRGSIQHGIRTVFNRVKNILSKSGV